MNERTHCDIYLRDHLCLVWPMPGTSLPVGMNVCVLSIMAGADECEVAHSNQHSQSDVGQVPLVTLESKNMSRTVLTKT